MECCPFCEEKHTCPLCLAQVDMSHEDAVQVEGLRIALAFAEFGVVPEMRLEP